MSYGGVVLWLEIIKFFWFEKVYEEEENVQMGQQQSEPGSTLRFDYERD